MSAEETLAQLYVGTSPGFRKVHVRPADGDAVFAVAFNSWEASAKADDWIDKDILKLDEAEISRVEMPDFELHRDANELKLRDLGDAEVSNLEQTRSLIDKLASLRIQSLLGTEAKPAYRQDVPILELKVALEDGDALSYRFSQPEDAAYYVLKRSDLDHYFKVAEFSLKPILETTRETLVQHKSADQPDRTAESAIHAEAPLSSAN